MPFLDRRASRQNPHRPKRLAPRLSTFQPLSFTKRSRAWNSFSLAWGPVVVFRQNQPAREPSTRLYYLAHLGFENIFQNEGLFGLQQKLGPLAALPRVGAEGPGAAPYKLPVLSMASLPVNNDSGASSGFGGASLLGLRLVLRPRERFFLGFGAAFSRASGSASGAVQRSVMTALIVFLKGFSRASSTSNRRAARSHVALRRQALGQAREELGVLLASSSTALRTWSPVTSAMVSRGSAVSSGRGDVVQSLGPVVVRQRARGFEWAQKPAAANRQPRRGGRNFRSLIPQRAG